MELTVLRFASDDDATLSMVAIDERFECFGLEDEYRAHKIPGETRIPAGRYPVRVRKEGGFHNRYADKFPGMHLGMLEICDVPLFEYVLIHVGNTDDDTAGCLLVGASCTTLGELTVAASRLAYIDLYGKVIMSALAGELFINFVDGD